MAARLSNSMLHKIPEQVYLPLLAELFRQKGWRVRELVRVGERHADLLVSQNNLRYVVELKVSSESRRDRLIPLLAQAILQARAVAAQSSPPASPLPVVAAPFISTPVLRSLQEFLAANASDVPVGILDGQGFRLFLGLGLEDLSTDAPSRKRKQRQQLAEPTFLFSDLNQWMLKVLLAPSLSPQILHAPRRSFRNASELAVVAEVSAMSASRFLRQLRREGFLEEDDDRLRLVRLESLLNRWQAAYLRTASELPLRWIVPNRSGEQLVATLQSYNSPNGPHRERSLRACLGLFAAAEALGFGFVHGVPQYIYLDRLDRDVLQKLGLSPENAEHAPEVYARVPPFRESVFRGAVERDGIPVADALQIWLDVGSHPARGAEQANQIFRRVVEPLWGGPR